MQGAIVTLLTTGALALPAAASHPALGPPPAATFGRLHDLAAELAESAAQLHHAAEAQAHRVGRQEGHALLRLHTLDERAAHFLDEVERYGRGLEGPAWGSEPPEWGFGPGPWSSGATERGFDRTDRLAHAGKGFDRTERDFRRLFDAYRRAAAAYPDLHGDESLDRSMHRVEGLMLDLIPFFDDGGVHSIDRTWPPDPGAGPFDPGHRRYDPRRGDRTGDGARIHVGYDWKQ